MRNACDTRFLVNRPVTFDLAVTLPVTFPIFLALIGIISLRALERHLAYLCATLGSGDDRG